MLTTLATLGGCTREAPSARGPRLSSDTRTIHVMAPLVVGDPLDPYGAASEPAWQRLRRELREVRALGAQAVSTDVWWGVVERDGDQRFTWDYYDRLAGEIARADLAWAPILSLHQCGGNVGDACDIAIPSWLGAKYVARGAVARESDLLYRSARGHVSHEVLSAWATPLVREEYRELVEAFQEHFAASASRIVEVNVSLGPAGELRYPSYNAHDPGHGYPTRGTLQSYGPLAEASFRRAMREKYGSVERIGEAWGVPIAREDDVAPPRDGDRFFDDGGPMTAYGKDFFAWYQASLLEHGRTILTDAVEVLGREGAPLRGVALGAKVPGVHWRVGSDRAAELTAGLLSTADHDDFARPERGAGYDAVVSLFAEIGRLPRAPRVILHFTCLEMDDGEDGPAVASRARSLVVWVGRHATRRGVPIKGENALAPTLFTERAWERIDEALAHDGYAGLTVLRLDALLSDPTARSGLRAMANRFVRSTPHSADRTAPTSR